jgi:hypothetical protein
MRKRVVLLGLSTLLAAVSCSGSTPTETGTLQLTTPPDFVATVSRITHQQGVSPAGSLSQYDFWLVIAPSSAANAGLVVGKSVPVFRRAADGAILVSRASAIRLGDVVEVWHEPGADYGAVQAPPSSPAYFGAQLVIRP